MSEWIEWAGGENPVGAIKVDVRRADGRQANDLWAHRLDWFHFSQWACDWNIVSYRISEA